MHAKKWEKGTAPMKFERWFAVLSALLLCLLPVYAWAQPVDYKLSIAPFEAMRQPATSENMHDVLGNGTVRYTPANGSEPAVLTLTNASLEYINGISGMSPLRIVLTGTSTVHALSASSKNCIRLENDLEITGSGKLVLQNDYEEQGYGFACIETTGNLTIDGAEIEAASKGIAVTICGYGKVDICNGAKVTASTTGQGLALASYGGDLTIEDSAIKAASANYALYSAGTILISGSEAAVDVEARAVCWEAASK